MPVHEFELARSSDQVRKRERSSSRILPVSDSWGGKASSVVYALAAPR